MHAIFYLKRRSFANRLKKALHKPVTYIYFVLIILYAIMMLFAIPNMLRTFGLDTPKGLVGVITFLVFMFLPANIASYVKRKGLLFTPSDVHFLFQTPISPKKVLLNAQMKQIFATAILGLFLFILGIICFQVAVIPMLLYTFVYVVLENILEGSLAILLYGNETIPEKIMKRLPMIMYFIMAGFVIAVGVALYVRGFSFEALQEIIFSPYVLCFPIIGWTISVAHVLFLGPTTLTVILSILYLFTVFGMLILAIKMPCLGAYYENAMKFAEDYQEARKKSLRGEMAFIGKKKKLGKAQIIYKGNYAKAIFYRQILEYKKSKFFIFGGTTFIALLVGAGLCAFMFFNASEMADGQKYALFFIPGVMAYMSLIFSGYATKWSKELNYSITFMLPDSAIKKLWYATLTEHIRSLVDGCLYAIPASIVLKIPFPIVLLTILFYVLLQANKLYLNVLVEGILGNVLGVFGKQMMRMLFYGIIISVSALPAVLLTIFVNPTVGFIAMFSTILVLSVASMAVSARTFERMEPVG